MREIKFRAKVIHNHFEKPDGTYRLPQGSWVYGCLVKDCNERPMIDIQGYVDGSGVHYEYYVDPETVGQFTGLLDKNGKEIYEGDIIIAGRYEIVEVIFDNGAFQIRYTLTDGSKHQIPFTSLGCKYYVIGNIYDNPEMLKGGTL